MPSFTINIPIRNADADDVKAAFASAYSYNATITQGNGIVVNNPLSMEQFVQQCCINFMLEITKKYLVQVEEIAARAAASEAAAQRAVEVTAWFDDRRLESIGGIEIYNQFPQIEDININCNQDNPCDINLVGTDPDNLDLTFEILSGPTQGQISGTQPNFVYTPNSGYSGTDTISYRASNGTKYSLIKNISIVINGIPVVQNMTVETSRNTNKAFTVTVNDYVDTGMVYTTVKSPINGVITGVAPNYVFEPYYDFHGSDSFQFKVNDGFFDSNVATITLIINDPPVADDQILQIAMNAPTNITLTGSDPDGDQLVFSIVSSPSHGTLTGSSPIFEYTPSADYAGTDSFTFVAFDGYAYSQLATVILNIS